MNLELSPQVAIEAQITRIPAFFQNLSRLGSYLGPKDVPNMVNTLLRNQAKAAQKEQSPSPCRCPHVLISDDDPFQEFYYQVLFRKMIESQEFHVKKEDFRMMVFKSGEELLEKYATLHNNCSCGGCMLIITDYDMGRQKLNGVDTSVLLRKLGYHGPIILRTSEKEEDLCKMSSNFKTVMETKVINSVQEKSKNAAIKDIVYKFMTEQMSQLG